MRKIKNKEDDKPNFTFYRSDKTADYFDKYTDLTGFGEDISNGLISLDEAESNK